MAHFPIKNENSSCDVFLFCQNKVPNQFPIFVMKYAYGSGFLNLGWNQWRRFFRKNL